MVGNNNIPYVIQPLFMQQRVESTGVETTAWLRVLHKDKNILKNEGAMVKEFTVKYT